MAKTVRSSLLLVLGWCVLLSAAHAQDTDFDAAWYNPSATYVKVAVIQDGVYQITGADLAALGLSTAGIAPDNIKLLKNGQEIPLWYQGDAGTLTAESKFLFVGQRNRGDEESWAYSNDPTLQSSTFFSLYTDTTFYWLSWDGASGARYQSASPTGGAAPDVFAFRDTLHFEEEEFYYDGDGTTNAENPFYTRGEGTYGSEFDHSGNNPTDPIEQEALTEALALARDTNPDDSVVVRVKLNSFTNTRHRFTLEVETDANGAQTRRLYDEEDWTGYAFRTLRAAFPAREVPANNQIRTYITSFNEFNAQPNETYFDWIDVSYVREMVAQDGALRIVYPDAAARRLNLSGFGDEPVLVFSPTDQRLFELTPTAGRVAFTDQPSRAPVYWAVASSAARTPAAFSVDQSSNWAATSHEADYVVITTPFLRASAEAFAAYRRMHNGHRVVIVEVQDLYDQFDYGRPTPLAIRRFVHQMQRWRTPPRYLLFWGDALYAGNKRISKLARPAWEVISYGKASSDGWFAMQYGGPEDWTETVAIGRVSIRDNETGVNFVQKLQNYESQPLGDWQKRMLVLVGGRGSGEQATLQSFVQPWARRAIAAPTGMDTLNFFRDSEAPLDASFQDTLRLALRQGASWLTYFGHSFAVGWEIVTDQPEDFDNAQRLPLAISLGCRTGAFAGGRSVQADTPVLAEKLVTESPNGAIAHWGSSGLGSVTASRDLGDLMHELVFTDTLRTIGEIFQEVKRRYAIRGPSLRDLTQFGLIGDPATRLDIPVLPDFEMTQDLIRITPEVPIPADEALVVRVRPKDLGLVPPDSITVQLAHIAPDGAETLYVQRVPPFRLIGETIFAVPIDKSIVGENRFRVTIDPENAYPEVTETNNTAERTHVVFSTGVSLIAPLDMNAVASTLPRLRVTFPRQDTEGINVLFELDTTPSYDSPDLRTFSTPATGTVAVWQLTEPLAANRAYYWRARIETDDGLINWQDASFFVEEGIAGTAWIQGGRLFDTNTQDFRLRREDDRWAFNDYSVEVAFNSERGGGQFKGQFVVNGEQYERLELGFGMLILDGRSGAVRATGSMPTYPNQFEDPAEAKAELESLVALINEGDYVYVRTRHLGNDGDLIIPEDIKDIFRALGSTAIDTLDYSNLWLLRTRAGHPEETQEWAVPAAVTNEISQEEILSFTHGEGQTTSSRIGPVRAWDRIEWQAELANTDSEIRIDVLDAAGTNTLIEGLTTKPADLSAIDPEEHPFLRLRATLVDSSQSSTPQLTQWRVHYAAIAELALDASSFTVSADTVQEAQTLTASASITNLSDQPADTVVFTLSITDFLNRTFPVATDTLLGLAAEETATVTFDVNTTGFAGRNVLRLEARQPGLTEPITFNNTAITEFRVQGDESAPLLRVTVDGEAYPNDPDPISNQQSPDIPLLPPQPTIEIVFSDDNAFKLLTDTTLAIVRLDGVRIPFTSPDLTFEPATSEKNEARILYTPDFTGDDGVHTLQVEAFDVSGNEAEGSPYQFHFRIESAFEIGTVYPYPNPMHRFTQFAFLLKGADPAVIDDFRIRIFTITGQVIQEFDLVENPALLDGGQFRIGWNKVFWDGRDADGDQVATGVYLYKVYLKVEGESIEANESPVEKIVVFQ